MPLSPRQEGLLRAIIKHYTASAKPVSSGQLADLKSLGVSPATVRNDMAVLEEAGFLQQPYTSAGRIPTEKAWRWYVQQIDESSVITRHDQQKLEHVAHNHRSNDEERVRNVAKALGDLIDETIVVSFGKTNTYATGLSKLFQQPEFEDVTALLNLSRMIDQMDDVMTAMLEHIRGDVNVFVGTENPLSPQLSIVVVRYNRPQHHAGLIGILGPLRQDYSEHMALLRYTQSLLHSA